MASLGTVTFTGYTNVSSTGSLGSTPILEAIGSADDADYAYDATNSNHTGSCYFTLTGLPTDIQSVTALNVELRYHWQTGTQVNAWTNLDARIYKSDGTTALTDSRSIATSITTTTPTNSTALAFTGVDTAATQADWDSARLYIYWTISKSMAGDTLEKRVTAGELTGTYTAVPPAVPTVKPMVGVIPIRWRR